MHYFPGLHLWYIFVNHWSNVLDVWEEVDLARTREGSKKITVYVESSCLSPKVWEERLLQEVTVFLGERHNSANYCVVPCDQN